MKQRIGVLDSFRGIAALSVVYYHLTHWFRQKHGHNFSDSYDFIYGSYAVYFFFIISGFVIFMTVERCKSVTEFGYKRFIRLYPTYWICVILTTIAIYMFGLPEEKPSLIEFAVNFTMIQKLLKFDDIDPSYWSLVPELAFYFIIIFAFMTKQLSKFYLWGGLWVFLSLLRGIFHIHLPEIFFRYSGLFVTGILFYKIFTGDNRVIHHFSIFICFIVVILNLDIQGELDFKNYLPVTIIYSLFYLFLYHKLDFLDTKILRFLGYISYPLYLIHQEIGFIILLRLKNLGFNDYWIIFIPMLFTIFIAYVIATFIEKPIIKYAKTNIERKYFVRGKDVPNTTEHPILLSDEK